MFSTPAELFFAFTVDVTKSRYEGSHDSLGRLIGAFMKEAARIEREIEGENKSDRAYRTAARIHIEVMPASLPGDPETEHRLVVGRSSHYRGIDRLRAFDIYAAYNPRSGEMMSAVGCNVENIWSQLVSWDGVSNNYVAEYETEHS